MTNPKHYVRPQTLDDALSHVSPHAIALAGGALAFAALDLPFETVIDLQEIAALREIVVQGDDETLAIGGAVSLQTLVELPLIPPALKRSLTRALPLNIRRGATVGESLSVTRPPREWLAALVALDAGVELAAPHGEHRLVPIAELLDTFDTPRREIITQLYVAHLHGAAALDRRREALGTACIARTPADEPIVNAAAFVCLGDDGLVGSARLGIGGAAPLPVISLHLATLEGHPLDAANIASAVKLVPVAVEPVGDYRSEGYRREMARVCAARALHDAWQQFQAEPASTGGAAFSSDH